MGRPGNSPGDGIGHVVRGERFRDAAVDGGGPGLAAASGRVLAGPRLPEWLAPLGLIVPGQLLTEALARRRGIDPDNPRGLSKVTQTA